MAEEKYEDGPVHLSKGTIVGNQWKVVKKLGEGGCGAVYMVECTTGFKQMAALKAESNFVEGGSVLKIEVDILTRLKGKKHVAELFHAGKKEKYQYMVMSLLGESLNNLLKRCGKQVSVSTQLRVGLQVLYGLKQVHDIGCIHRDIKPANLAIGRNGCSDTNFIHILDFGLAREFVIQEPDGTYKMRKPRKHALFRGTTRYCSINTHEKAEQGRCDDLWSLLYVIAEMRGKLPWTALKEKKDLLECKKNTTDEDLLKQSPPHLIKFANHLRTLDYWTRPDYVILYRSIHDAMHEGGYRWKDAWDWDKQSSLRKLTKAQTPGGDKSTSSKVSCRTASTAKDPSKRNVRTVMGEEKTTMDNDDPAPFQEEDFATDPLGF